VKSIRTHAALRSTGIAALVLVGAWCAPTLASNGLSSASEESSNSVPTAAAEVASPILIEKIDTPLHQTGDRNDAEAGLKPVGITQSSPNPVFPKYEKFESDAEKSTEETRLQVIVPRLPGVSSASLPRFRREMFRTDI